MVNLLILFFFYTLILISSLGFGFLLTSKKDKEISIGFIGLKGIFILILLSYLTNFFLKHNIISIGINSLNFDNEHKRQKWNSYSLINEFDFHAWRVNTTLAYNFNTNFSFTNISIYIYNNIYKNFDIGFGTNISNFSSLMTNIYIGIKYKL